ncbi:MAG: PEGA domain-containing protein, partial [Myxococcota bacterium]|nr:PEGA domain-containing protein [Myxococcota bacterium]
MKALSVPRLRPRIRVCLAVVTLWAACLLTPVSAQAKGPAKLAPAEIEVLVKKAKTLVATRNVVQALAIYEQLHEATGAPKYLYNIGYLYEDMGQLDVAWDYYQRFLLAWPDAPNASELQTYLGELAEELGKAYVLVHVFSAPPGASVEIVTDEGTRQPSGVTPMSTWMPFGKVLVRLRLEGHAMLDKKITVKRRKSQRLRLTMEPLAQPGFLTCGEMEEGMALSVDGKVRPDATTGARLSLPPGEHTLVLTLADGSERTII